MKMTIKELIIKEGRWFGGIKPKDNIAFTGITVSAKGKAVLYGLD